MCLIYIILKICLYKNYLEDIPENIFGHIHADRDLYRYLDTYLCDYIPAHIQSKVIEFHLKAPKRLYCQAFC